MHDKTTEEIKVDFRTYLESTKSESTLPSYISRLSLWMKYTEDKGIDLYSPTVMDVIRFISEYRTAKGEPWAATSREQTKIILLSFYNFMADVVNLIEVNPLAKGLEIKQIDTETPKYDVGEVEKIVAFLKDKDEFDAKIKNYTYKKDYLAATLIFRDTGLRISHTLSITVDQIKPTLKVIEFPPTKYKSKGTPSEAYISNETATVLRELMRGKKPGDRLLNISPTSLRSIYIQMSAVLHIHVHCHRFRSSWASKFGSEINNYPALKEQGGWKGDSAMRYIQGAGKVLESTIRDKMFND